MEFVIVLFEVKVGPLQLPNQTKPYKVQQKQKARYVRLKWMSVLFST